MEDRTLPRGAWAVVVAAGKGTRFGRPYNKVFHRINGRSVLMRCLDALQACRLFGGALLVLSQDDMAAYEQLIAQEGASPLVKGIVPGGSTRQESVRHGLDALPAEAEIVAIHDAARPFVTASIVRAVLESARKCGSGVPGFPVTDTIKLLDEQGNAVSTPPRDRLCAVQTPQAFRRGEIARAHAQAAADGYAATDDAALYEKYIGKVRVIMNAEFADNIKVTTPKDVRPFQCPYRIGTGYDAHRLVEGRKLVLCGVDVPFEKGLLGHSDADVAVHALIDALLGAAALGDIGQHFPDSDMRYRGISSLKLLDETVALLQMHGFHPANVDVTIVAQRPKLRDYVPQMRRNIAIHLGISEGNVSVKATTTEGMGFEGEGLGISAQASAMIVSQERFERVRHGGTLV